MFILESQKIKRIEYRFLRMRKLESEETVPENWLLLRDLFRIQRNVLESNKEEQAATAEATIGEGAGTILTMLKF